MSARLIGTPRVSVSVGSLLGRGLLVDAKVVWCGGCGFGVNAALTDTCPYCRRRLPLRKGGNDAPIAC